MMLSRQLLALKSQLAILGSLGSGTQGDHTSNNAALANAAFVGPLATVDFTSAAYTSKSGKVLVIGFASASNTHAATLAAADKVTFSLIRDIGGGGTDIATDLPVGAVTTGSEVAALGVVAWIDTVTPGISHTYSIQAAVAGGHTASFEVNQAAIITIDL